MPEKMLTVQEVAALLGTTTRAVQKYANYGYFPNARKMSPTRTAPWLIPEKEVLEYLELTKIRKVKQA